MALDSETFSTREFLEYMKPEKLDYLIRSRRLENCNWVFWSKENDDESQILESLCGTLDHSSQISKKIKYVLLKAQPRWGWRWSLVQFWAPKKIGDRCFLTTSSQPFALYKLRKKCGSYRKLCVEKHISIREEGDDDDEEEEEEEKEGLGPIGRAFRNKLPEWSPHVQFYSRQEFPLVDHASFSFKHGIFAFPVFEIESQTCVGVLLEFLGYPLDINSLGSDILSFEEHLEVAGLALNHPYSKPVPKDQPDSWNEIKKACKVVAQTHPLLFALAFIPSAGCWENEGCGRDFSDLGLLKLAFREKFFNGESFDEFINAHKAFYLKKGKGVSGKAFAFLKSCFCRNICDFTVTEYPLVHYARVAKLNLSFAICLRTTKLEKSLLVVEFFLSLDSYGNHYSLLQSLLTKFKEHIQSFEVVAEDMPIEELFPKGSLSTLKRRCRSYGIQTWPCSKKNKGDIHSVSAMQNTEGGEGSNSVPGTPSSLNLSSQENVQSFGPVTPNIVCIRVSDEERGTISFGPLPMPTLAELEEEVAQRLKVNVGSIRLTYDDEEDDPITITCDEDLQHCAEIMTSIGSTINFSDYNLYL